MKVCIACNRNLPITDYYRHPGMKDGHLGKCKNCQKENSTMNRNRNIESRREYDRMRSKLPHRKAQNVRVSSNWRAAHPQRYKAHSVLNNAKRAGKILQPNRCQKCNKSKRLEAHHEDYSQPLSVEWLCKPCHAEADKLRRANENLLTIHKE